jgi:RNA polymerase sigma factor (sigma-70 family)
MTDEEIHKQLRHWHKDSFGWALHCCAANEADAEDILQTVYLKVLEGKAKFDGKSAFKTWLFSVIRFSAIDALRRQKVRQSKLEIVKKEAETSTMISEESEEARAEPDLEKFKAALERLPDRQREIMLLVFYHDHSISEAAVVMGVSLGTARTHYERGKEALRKTLSMEQ